MMSRATWKGPYVVKVVVEKKTKLSGVRLFAKSSVILPSFVNHLFYVHDGKQFFSVIPTESMIGQLFGSFVTTKKIPEYKKKKKKKKK